MKPLRVLFEGVEVASAVPERGRFALEYDEGWERLPFAFPVSRTLPLLGGPYSPDRAHPFFANLLPEGLARQTTCERLGISVDNDVELLRALGDDTAGAFTFVTGEDSRPSTPRLPITADMLETWSGGEPPLPQERPVRLSLAGAQHKTTVVRSEGGWSLPASNEASTHILKFDSPRFKHLSINEFLTTRFAAHLGLQTVDVALATESERPFLVVRRYDRTTGARTSRLHQEDFCQATGRLPTQKYEKEGGPGYAEIAAIIRTDSSSPAEDLLRLVQWAVFCALAGNADAHAKNISMLYAEGTRLAPFYDLVCTRAFPNVNKSLALNVGGRSDTSRLDADTWTTFAAECGLGKRAVLRELDRQLQGWEAAFESARAELAGTIEAPDVVATIRREVGKRARELAA